MIESISNHNQQVVEVVLALVIALVADLAVVLHLVDEEAVSQVDEVGDDEVEEVGKKSDFLK
jgi:hypothetical protein